MTPSSEDAANPKPPRRQRRRPPRACQQCRRRKIKCDLKQPCSHCVVSRCRCTYGIDVVHDLPTDSTASYTTSPQLPVSGRTPTSTVTRTHEPDDHRASLPSTYAISLISKDQELDRLNQRLRDLEDQLFSSRSGTISHCLVPTTSPLATTQLSLNKSRLFGQSHWIYGGHDFRETVQLMNGELDNSSEDETTKKLRSEILALLQKCKLLARSLKTSRPSRSPLWVEQDLDIPHKDFADRMVQLYLSRFESAMRVLHIPSFWVDYAQYWTNPKMAPAALQLKVKLVVAIGFSLYQEARETDRMYLAVRQWVHAAQNWLSGPMEKDRISISGLQIQCLLIIARQALSVGGDLIWVALGTLQRTAKYMGLHRDPKHYTRMITLHAEIRRRLWATILEMNVQAALDAGVAPALSLDDFDTEAPSSLNDEDIDDSTTSLPQHSTGLATDTSLQRLLFENLRPRLEILRCVNGTGRAFSPEEVHVLTAQINSACRECGSHIPQDSIEDVQLFRHNMADLLLRRFLITLHRPFASGAYQGPMSYFSRKICLDSATAILRPAPNRDFSHLLLLGGGLFKNRLIHASMAVATELLIEVKEHGITPWPSSYRGMLIDSLMDALRQAAGRVQLGETNARLHMMLSTFLCQAECTETGAALQRCLVQAAKNSLEMSLATMQARSKLGIPTQSMLETSDFDQQQDFNFSIWSDFDDLFGMADFGME